MAKISARGATVVAKLKGKLPNSDGTATWVVTSDGRILRKYDGLGGGYNVVSRIRSADQVSEATLRKVMAQYGYIVA